VDEDELHPAAKLPAAELLPLERLEALFARPEEEQPPAALDASYAPFLPMGSLQYQWNCFESEEQLEKRLRTFFDAVAASHPGQTVLLVSHGGPSAALVDAVAPARHSPACGYCGLYAFRRNGSDWEALLRADHEHLKGVNAPATGPNDLLEQMAKAGCRGVGNMA